MKIHKISATFYYIAAVLLDIAAILSFTSGEGNSMGYIWLSLGSIFLCLGTFMSRRSRKDIENKDAENKDSEEDK